MAYQIPNKICKICSTAEQLRVATGVCVTSWKSIRGKNLPDGRGRVSDLPLSFTPDADCLPKLIFDLFFKRRARQSWESLHGGRLHADGWVQLDACFIFHDGFFIEEDILRWAPRFSMTSFLWEDRSMGTTRLSGILQKSLVFERGHYRQFFWRPCDDYWRRLYSS